MYHLNSKYNISPKQNNNLAPDEAKITSSSSLLAENDFIILKVVKSEKKSYLRPDLYIGMIGWDLKLIVL
jgi:hypothetical protein